mgnify:CR=1 FL=1
MVLIGIALVVVYLLMNKSSEGMNSVRRKLRRNNKNRNLPSVQGYNSSTYSTSSNSSNRTNPYDPNDDLNSSGASN